MRASPAETEWIALQHDHERYETSALLIKLVAVVLATFGISAAWPPLAMIVPVPILWLQEGILRTSQARLGARLLRIESGGSDAFRLHTEWQASRPGIAGLLAEYFGNALRPTVAFPYVVLLVLAGLVVSTR